MPAAYPQPLYRWIKDGHYLNEQFSQENYHRILDVQRADAGLYQCVAKNTVGAIVSNHINVTVACECGILVCYSHVRRPAVQ